MDSRVHSRKRQAVNHFYSLSLCVQQPQLLLTTTTTHTQIHSTTQSLLSVTLYSCVSDITLYAIAICNGIEQFFTHTVPYIWCIYIYIYVYKLFTRNDRGVDFYFEPASLIFEASPISSSTSFSFVFFFLLLLLLQLHWNTQHSLFTHTKCLHTFYFVFSSFLVIHSSLFCC